VQALFGRIDVCLDDLVQALFGRIDVCLDDLVQALLGRIKVTLDFPLPQFTLDFGQTLLGRIEMNWNNHY
jgi:hypothetical protein